MELEELEVGELCGGGDDRLAATLRRRARARGAHALPPVRRCAGAPARRARRTASSSSGAAESAGRCCGVPAGRLEGEAIGTTIRRPHHRQGEVMLPPAVEFEVMCQRGSQRCRRRRRRSAVKITGRAGLVRRVGRSRGAARSQAGAELAALASRRARARAARARRAARAASSATAGDPSCAALCSSAGYLPGTPIQSHVGATE